MKVVMLDFDGVIHIAGKFSKAAINNLNSLLDSDPKLKIVISSSWRHKGSKYCENVLEENGVDPDRVVGMTDLTMRDDRGHHIERWIEDNKPEAFVVLDDHDDMDKVVDHLVQVNPYIGLTSTNIKKSLDILKKT